MNEKISTTERTQKYETANVHVLIYFESNLIIYSDLDEYNWLLNKYTLIEYSTWCILHEKITAINKNSKFKFKIFITVEI